MTDIQSFIQSRSTSYILEMSGLEEMSMRQKLRKREKDKAWKWERQNDIHCLSDGMVCK